jgi:hypothetical protein
VHPRPADLRRQLTTVITGRMVTVIVALNAYVLHAMPLT